MARKLGAVSSGMPSPWDLELTEAGQAPTAWVSPIGRCRSLPASKRGLETTSTDNLVLGYW
eukprot:scaffold14789_cov48-Attheya_sp.AAC.2